MAIVRESSGVRYKASVGITVWVLTVLVTLLLAGVAALLIYEGLRMRGYGSLILFVVAGAIAAFYLLIFLFRVTGYRLEKRGVVIRRPWRDRVIPYSEIKDAFIVKKDTMGWPNKTTGNAGLFGFTGNFQTSFGMTTWYATQLRNYLLIRTLDDDRIILTPDDTGMVEGIRKFMNTKF